MKQILLVGQETPESASIAEALSARSARFERAAGSADALRRLRTQRFDTIITDPATTVEEDLALLGEIRRIRPGVRVIVLAPRSAPEDIIAALRAHVFACFGAPFEPGVIAEMASRVSEVDWRNDIEVLAAHRDWVSLRANCRLLTAERLMTFLNELRSGLPEPVREDLMLAFREILFNAIEHGGRFDSGKIVEVAAIRTARAAVFYVRDPGAGFGATSIPHAAVSNPTGDSVAHLEHRVAQGLRPGGYGILVVRGIVDELMYSELGNEVLLIKYLA
jgi:anti-sigma regulatory factor (Ser/Thr protein kinase)/DNA-binding NarL/FixJ family response regulator